MPTDVELLDRWRAGDREAGGELFERYFQRIRRFFASKVDRDVEELVQQTFLGCVKHRDRFRQQASFQSYLFSIARRQLYRYLRQYYRHGDKFDVGVTSIADMNLTPRTMMARGEQKRTLLQALCTLPVEQQVLLELYYWEDMQVADLAGVFEVAPTTIRTRLFRARQTLRQTMGRLDGAGFDSDASIEDLDAWARRVRVELDPSAPRVHKSERYTSRASDLGPAVAWTLPSDMTHPQP